MVRYCLYNDSFTFGEIITNMELKKRMGCGRNDCLRWNECQNQEVKS